MPKSATKVLATSPAPNRLYRIQRGNTLLTVAGKAYAHGPGGERLRRAQLVNRHPFNWRYQRPATSSFNKKFFPDGIVTFTPRFSRVDADFDDPTQFPPRGKCFAIVFVPPKSDIWLRPPPEVLQPDLATCWAAAVLSWSKVTPGARRFRSVAHVVDKFRKMEIHIPTSSGTINRRLVNSSGALVRWPKRKVVFKTKAGASVTVEAGQITCEKLTAELGMEFVTEGNNLKLKDVISVLEKSAGPVMVLKSRTGKVGHASVIFGASKRDKFIGEMNPFPNPARPTGPAFGKLGTRWTPTHKSFTEHSGHIGAPKLWDEFVFLFMRK